jgi:hypothetical protein
MSSGEKKIAVVLVVILIAMVGAYFALGSKIDSAQMPGPPGMAGPGAPGGMMGPGGMAGQGGAAPATTIVGPEGAKVEIIALVPIAEGCHASTINALQQVYEEHPDDIRMTLIEFKGPEAPQWREKLGVTCATVSINGQYSFNLEGREVIFQKQEGGTYRPADLKAVVEAELARAG